MVTTSTFDLFKVSPDGRSLIYRGRTADGQRVEIEQPVDDVDVTVVLLANVLQRSLARRR